MRKNIMRKVVVLFAGVILLSTTITTKAADTVKTETKSIELETRSALLIDRSGSMEEIATVDAALGQYDLASYDAVVYFDHRLSTDREFKGGGNSSICETLDDLADAGFVHITVLTDGEQWPSDYSALGVYTDLDLNISLVEETKASTEFVNQLKGRLVNSNLKVEKPDGTEELILNDYKAPIYSIEVPVIEPDQEEEVKEQPDEGDTFIENINKGNFPWWLVLILAAIIAALFDFIHELITRRNEEEKDKKKQENTPDPKPMPAKAVAHIAQGAHVLADFSGSMAAQQSETARVCMETQKGDEAVLCFDDGAFSRKAKKLHKVQAGGRTAGWEALEKAAARGWDEIVIVSDLGFNVKPFDKNAFSKNFKKVTVVTPETYDHKVLEQIKQIADEVEMLQL